MYFKMITCTFKLQELCEWNCPHYKCTKLCYQICDRPPCTNPCFKKLKCGHQCIGYCGDVCPDLCRICNMDKIEETADIFGYDVDASTR